MKSYSRPEQLHLRLERTAVVGVCPRCGGSTIASYPVISEGGWWRVTKCQSCLFSLERDRMPLLGELDVLPDGV